MALEQVHKCDKYGTYKDVRGFRISVVEVDLTSKEEIEGSGRGIVKYADLSPRAMDALYAGIDRALAPPKSRAVAEPASEDKQ